MITKEQMEKFETMAPSLLKKIFEQSCMQGKIDNVEYIIEHHFKEKFTPTLLFRSLGLASNQGQLDIVKYFMNYKFSSDIPTQKINYLFSDKNKIELLCMAASNNHLNVVKYFIEASVLKDDFYNIKSIKSILINSATYDSLDIIRYFCENKQFEIFINPQIIHNMLLYSSRYGHLNTFKYLLENPMGHKINIHKKNDDVFKTAVYYNKYDIVKYLVSDYNIKLNSSISEYISTNEDIKNMFIVRLNDTLEYNLNNSKKIKKQSKI